MDHECAACGCDYSVRDGMEPTPLCDACAHCEVDRLRTQLAAAVAAEREARRGLAEQLRTAALLDDWATFDGLLREGVAGL